MRLSSVRSLKEELLSVPAAVAADLAESPQFAAFSARHATARRTMDGIALGVVMAKKQKFRLAVRLQRTGPLISAMTEHIRKRGVSAQRDEKFHRRGQSGDAEVGTIPSRHKTLYLSLRSTGLDGLRTMNRFQSNRQVAKA